MLQRPQTLLFLAATILTIVASFAPLVYFSPTYDEDKLSKSLDPAQVKKVKERTDKIASSLVVSSTGVYHTANYVKEYFISKEVFEEQLSIANETVQKQFETRGLNWIFTVGFLGTLFMAALMALLTFLYKNRKWQMRLGITMVLVTLTVTTGIFIAANVALDVFVEQKIIPKSVGNMNWEIGYGFGFFLFPLIAICLLIGVILVRKDDNLVKSLDRLR